MGSRSMIDRCHNDVTAKVKAIVDDAIAELLLLGMESRDEAAFLMASQAFVRIEGDDKRDEFKGFIGYLEGDDE
jgi:hypothetical protein